MRIGRPGVSSRSVGANTSHHAMTPHNPRNSSVSDKVSIAPCDEDGVLRLDEFERLFTPETRLVVMQYASNVSGTIQPVREIGAICRRHGVLFAVDSAQAAGHFTFDKRRGSIGTCHACAIVKGFLTGNGWIEISAIVVVLTFTFSAMTNATFLSK